MKNWKNEDSPYGKKWMHEKWKFAILIEMKDRGCMECVCEIWRCFEMIVEDVYWKVKLESWLKVEGVNDANWKWIRKEWGGVRDFVNE